MQDTDLEMIAQCFEGEILDLDVPDFSKPREWLCKVNETGERLVLSACDIGEAEKAVLLKRPQHFRGGYRCQMVVDVHEGEEFFDAYTWLQDRLDKVVAALETVKVNQGNTKGTQVGEFFIWKSPKNNYVLYWRENKLAGFAQLKSAVAAAKTLIASGLVDSAKTITQEKLDAANWLLWQIIYYQLNLKRKRGKRDNSSIEVSIAEDSQDSTGKRDSSLL